MKNIVIYARYSSEAQRKESIKQQVEACKKFAESNDMNVIHVYKDEAKTGRNDERDDFQRMIRDSRNRGFEAVLVWKFDRFARNIRDALNYEHSLEENGVKVISATELIPEGAIGIICKAVLLGVNEFYSVDLAEKTQRGMIDNAKQCLFNGGTVPFGFKISKDKKFEIDEDNAKWVNKIYTMYASGKTVVEICEYLNSLGVKTARGKEFNKGSLHTILGNEKYIGTYSHADIVIPNGIPRIIDDELFYNVQKVLEQNKAMPSRKKAVEDYLLTGKLFCGHCKDKRGKDVAMIGHSGNAKKKYCYYKCKSDCGKKMVPKAYIEELVLQACRSILTTKNISKIAKKIYAISQKDNANLTLTKLKGELKDRQAAKENLMKSLEVCADNYIYQEIFARIKALNGEIDRLEAEVAIENTKVLGVDEKEIEFFLTQFRKYDVLNVNHRKALVNMLVNKVYLYDNKIVFTFQSGSGEVEITKELYEDIKNNTDAFCFSQNSVHQKKNPIER